MSNADDPATVAPDPKCSGKITAAREQHAIGSQCWHTPREHPRVVSDFAAAGKPERRVEDPRRGEPLVERLAACHEYDTHFGTELTHRATEIARKRLGA